MDWLENLDPNVTAALISAVVAVFVLILGWILRSLYERRFHIFKLEYEHRYDQRKQIKEILARNKIQLLSACDSLNHRIANLYENFDKGWHQFDDQNEVKVNHYYLTSFVYRLVTVFSWVRIIERQMVYLDTTIAGRNDLEFVKFLRLLPRILTDGSLFEGFKYDTFFATDHFFRNNLENMSDSLVDDDKVKPFSEFQQNLESYKTALEPVFSFINGIHPDEDRLRWDRLQSLHVILLTFLNSYGYDFQESSRTELREVLRTPRPIRVPRSLLRIIGIYKMDHHKQLKKLTKELKRLAT